MIHARSAPGGLSAAGAAVLALLSAGCANDVALGVGIAP